MENAISKWGSMEMSFLSIAITKIVFDLSSYHDDNIKRKEELIEMIWKR